MVRVLEAVLLQSLESKCLNRYGNLLNSGQNLEVAERPLVASRVHIHDVHIYPGKKVDIIKYAKNQHKIGVRAIAESYGIDKI